ncbi:WD40 repeat-like protein [Corynespora cassiicola Philippines]|uniref:Mitochondrial division protein 1 n=1 Tax=Corynespora cassiicola Philippines TaxID=1448308 RepID=A0A2T2N7Q0_CORCC|nr:WD40 repeat-like protein [Corynespora cassiicola Philippines]
MSSLPAHQPGHFTNDNNRIAIQAGQFNAYGNITVQHHDQDPLDRLPYAAEAAFNSYAKQHESLCLQGTRSDLLKEVYTWAEGKDPRCIFWLSGLAGSGKSTIARTVARKYHNEKRLAASFFFSRGGGDVGHASKFVTSIAVQLSQNVPVLRQYVYEAVTERGDIASQALRDQWEHIVLCPLSKLEKQGPYVIVVDALDECDNENDAQLIIRLLLEARSLGNVRIRILLTSRPEVPIRGEFSQITAAGHKDFVLHNIPTYIVNKDIELFLKTELQSVGLAGWPDDGAILQLARNASGLFIWAATACVFIRESGQRFAAKRLEVILRNDCNTPTTPEKHLDQIYTTVLEHSILAAYTDEEREEQCRAMRYVLGSLVVLYSPLSVQSLSKLLQYADEEEVKQILENLHAIINITEHPQPLHLHHPSFRDSLLDKKRCTNPDFWVPRHSTHEQLASCCLSLMTRAEGGLRQDMCALSDPGILRNDIEDSRIAANLTPELQYACRYWVDHLEHGQCSVRDGEATDEFLREHFLHWLEAMSLMKETNRCVRLVVKLRSLVELSSNVASFLYDAYRFVLRFASILTDAPLQIYSSALLFSPKTSPVRQVYTGKVPLTAEMIHGMDTDWENCLSVLHSRTEWRKKLAFSPDGQLLASQYKESAVGLWETMTGCCRDILIGHSVAIEAITFSPDGQFLATACFPGTVEVWNMTTRQYLHRLVYEENTVAYTIAFSSDSRRIFTLATGSFSTILRIWDVATGSCHRVFEWDTSKITSISFSQDDKVVVAGSGDGNLRVWKISGEPYYKTLTGHTNSVEAVAFLQDIGQVASASADSTLRVWDVAKGMCCSILEGHTGSVIAIAFSSIGQLIASASRDSTIRLWDATIKPSRKNSEGLGVDYFSFLPDTRLFISSGTEAEVLEVASRTLYRLPQDRTILNSAAAVSPDSQFFASAAFGSKIRIWEAVSGSLYKTLKGHEDCVTDVEFSPDSQLLVSGSRDQTVRVWDIASGSCHLKLEVHTGPIHGVGFSPNGRLVISRSLNSGVQMWELATKRYCMLQTHSSIIRAIAFSPDSHFVASISGDGKAQVWEVATGARLRETVLEKEDSCVSTVVFSSDGHSLRTEQGLIPLRPPIELSLSNQVPQLRHIFFRDHWIYLDNRRLLWVPVEYQSTRFQIHGNFVCFHRQSRVIVLLEIFLP